MKILHLSDTHGCHRQLKDLPLADIVVHSGDFTMCGSLLLTHCPPRGILDYDVINYGSEELLKHVCKVKPYLHLFGHIHKQHGVLTKYDIVFSNGSIMDNNYKQMQQPIINEVDICN